MSEQIFTWYSVSDSISSFEEGLNLVQASDSKSILILSCSENSFTAQQINPLLTAFPLPIFGGVFPKLIYKSELIEKGTIIIGLPSKVDIKLISQLSTLTTDTQIECAVEDALAQTSITPNENFLMFYDSLTDKTEDFIDCLFECLDHEITIVGGGSGNLSFQQQPCIFTNQGLLEDAIQLVSLNQKISAGIAHGWEILHGPFLVSEAHRNVIQSLNYNPALDVYTQTIEQASDYKFADSNFFDIAKHFPLGIEDINNQLVVRDPILSFNKSIQCVGDVPVNSMVYLLTSNIDSLCSSAEKAAISSMDKVQEREHTLSMVFDCISRVLYMEDAFNKELDLIAKHCSNKKLFGVLSLGEIANSQSGSIKLLNKSTVIGSW